MTTLKASIDKPAIFHTGGKRLYSDVQIDAANSARAIAVQQTGGVLRLSNTWLRGGHGPLITGDAFFWQGGGANGTTRKYGCGYFGNLHPSVNRRIAYVELVGLRFTTASLEEALLRCMGVDELVMRDCELDGTANKYGKEVCQFRHVRKLTVVDCDIKGSIVLGTLRPQDCKSDAERKAYLGDAHKYRITATFDESTRIWGHVRATGQTDLTCNGTQMMGRDPRGIGGSKAFTLETIDGIKPTLKLNGVRNVGKWAQLS
jgi:hypothetical protein